MRRPIIPCACLLALVTGAWFGQAYTLLAPSAPIEAADTTSRDAEAIARRYYDALDLHFRTGDDAALREIVSTDFIDHVDTPGSLANRDGLLGYLAELRASYPTLHLVHHDVIAQNDRAVAQISVDSPAEGTIMGISLGGAPPWPEVEIVRIEADKIVERWGGPAGYALSSPLFAEALTFPVGGDVFPNLRRVTVAPGATAPLDWMDPAIALMESGEIDAETDGDSGSSQPATIQTLEPGSSLVITEEVTIRLRNRTDTPAVMLLLSLAPPLGPTGGGQERGPDAVDSGITIQSLAGNAGVLVSAQGRLTAELAEITLAPGTHLASHPIGGVELVVIEAGTLTMMADGASFTAWLQDPDGHSVFPGRYSAMSEGYGLSISGLVDSIEGEVLTSYRNATDQPVTFLLLRLAGGELASRPPRSTLP